MKTSSPQRQDYISTAQPFRDFAAAQPSSSESRADESNGEAKPGIRKARAGANKSSAPSKTTKVSKPTQFTIEAPLAHSVKLVADFTNWEKAPLKMKKDENGEWQASVLLTRGRYEYRFIVNEEWHDDPRCTQKAPNPFGSMNAIIEVH